MLIKALSEVATRKEKTLLTNVRWRRLSEKGEAGFAQKAKITGLWKLGCSLVTRHNLLPGEKIWINAKDELGRQIVSLIGTVVWNDNIFSLDGYRCEVRFHEC